MRSSNEAKALDRSQVNSAIAVSSLPSPHPLLSQCEESNRYIGCDLRDHH